MLLSGISSTGGIQRFNNHLLKAMAEVTNLDSVVISISDASEPANFVFKFIPLGSRFEILNKIRFCFQSMLQFFLFDDIDFIVCGHINFSPWCILLNMIFKVPYFTIAHGIESWRLKGLKKLGIKHSSRIVSVSRFTKNEILSQLSVYPQKDIFILPDTLDEEEFKPQPKPEYLMEKLGIRQDNKIILTVARLSKTERCKGYDLVIVAMREIIKEITNAKYILVGSGDDKDRIETLIKDNDLQDKVILTGFIPQQEVIDYYSLCDVFVMPSSQEGFGIVFLEALACGKPVIAGNRDGSREALLNGRLGLLINPDDVNQIAEAIIKVLKGEVDNNLLDAKFLRESVIDNFGLKRFNHRVSEFFESYK